MTTLNKRDWDRLTKEMRRIESLKPGDKEYEERKQFFKKCRETYEKLHKKIGDDNMGIKDYISACCGASVYAEDGNGKVFKRGSTVWYECCECKKPCNFKVKENTK